MDFEIGYKNQLISPSLTKERLKIDLLMVLVVAMFLGLLAPFGMDRVSLLTRIAYWVFVCCSGYFIYTTFMQLAERYLTKAVPQYWGRFFISFTVATAAMVFFSSFAVWLFFDYPISFPPQFSRALPSILIISAIFITIGFVQDYIYQQNSKLRKSEQLIDQRLNKSTDQGERQVEKFMAHLPLEKRGKLLCLEMSDHYLKVYTDKGHHLVLMRLKDALALLKDYQGLQTHRSWWVAIDAITKVSKEGRKTFLGLSNELRVPVSKTYAEAVKAADIY